MQAALRIEINQLESGLTIIDDGAERSVDSGPIDITARDTSGMTVVVELKPGPAGQRAVAQILSYMGDVAAEEESGKVRGISSSLQVSMPRRRQLPGWRRVSSFANTACDFCSQMAKPELATILFT